MIPTCFYIDRPCRVLITAENVCTILDWFCNNYFFLEMLKGTWANHVILGEYNYNVEI
uniref:Uncharacterized protein n=1 Tax=Lepeophtheirus salmonis TaxID=72036 RepID=A0A0K2U436_LEPSM